MAEDILKKIKTGEPVTVDEIKKSTEGLTSTNEGFITKSFSLETGTEKTKDD